MCKPGECAVAQKLLIQDEEKDDFRLQNNEDELSKNSKYIKAITRVR